MKEKHKGYLKLKSGVILGITTRGNVYLPESPPTPTPVVVVKSMDGEGWVRQGLFVSETVFMDLYKKEIPNAVTLLYPIASFTIKQK